CEFYKSYKGFIKEPLNDEEANFPIAYSMLIYKDYEQFIRLFRAVYRPQNYYCIHVDKKTDSNYKSNVEALARCFPNGRVFVAPISYDVQWATFTVLQPELDCMRELSKMRPLWKYFINLTGQEYPLRTNWELIQILKIFDGANNVEGTFKRSYLIGRTQQVSFNGSLMHSVIRMYHAQNHPPRGIIIWKGSVHVVLSRAFVDFALHHPISIALQNYLKDIFVPDEYFFSTLNNNPNFGVPGSYNDPVNNRFIARFKNWGYPPFAWPCKGKWVRQICNFGVGDLPLLASRDELFANKFDYEFEPLAYNCMEELLFNRT
ncbi:hypothetical protein HELRODRAFT_139499, partial [Helobdella robusta]|uniref:Uncharacterized protein n=1 Tax=Helobdella robusta TaxID=6412 RepID=T1EIZ0_HELRO